MDVDYYLKMSKKEASAMCPPSSSSMSKGHMPRSFSTRSSVYSSSNNNSPLVMRRSCSTRSTGSYTTSSKPPPPPVSTLLPRSMSKKGSNITRKCTNLAKEQKARFYIMKRCITMLVCWHKHGDDSRR